MGDFFEINNEVFDMNKHYVRILMVGLIFLFVKNGIAQTSITGKISDKETGEDMISANIVISQNGNFIQGKTTDIDGNYSIRVDAGEYDMEISYPGYGTQRIIEIPVNKNQVTKVDVQISSGVIIDWPIIVNTSCGWVPLIRQDDTTTGMTLSTREDKEFFRKKTTRNINEMIMMTPGVTLDQ